MSSLSYHVALAYSNIQCIDEVPAFVAGVVTTEQFLSELKKRPTSQELLLRRKNSLFDLEQAFEDVSDYMTEFEVEN